MRKLVKKGIFTAAFIFAVLFAKNNVFAEPILVDSKNFPDANLRQAVLNTYTYVCDENGNFVTDKNGNYYIESDYVTSLYCYDKNGVKNLKGIELLTKLEAIHMRYCQFSSADFSSNTELRKISMSGKKLKTIKLGNYDIVRSFSVSSPVFNFDLSKLTNVKTLSITSNGLTSFDISNFANLKSLTLNANNLKELDLSNSQKLLSFKLVDCKNLKLINIGENKILTSINIENAPKLVSLDISNCPALNYVDISNSSIKKLDVSNNKELSSLRLINNKKISSIDVSKNKELIEINVGASGIKTLNTSKNLKLESLYVNDTKINSLNLKNNKSLIDICYSGSKIKSLPLAKLYNNLTMTYFDIKRGSSINLSSYIGKGYKIASNSSSKYITYDSKKGIVKTSKKNIKDSSDIITLKKGKKTYQIQIFYK